MRVAFFFVVILFFSLGACSPAKLVPEGKQWYHDAEIKVNGKLTDEAKSNLPLMIRQKPNKKSLFWRSFRLDWYNFMGGDEKEINGNWVSRQWKRLTNWSANTIGTPPVALDRSHNKRSVEMMRDYLKSKGYYFAQVRDSLTVDSVWFFKDPKVRVSYVIKPGKPYKIRKINYVFADTNILKYVEKDSVNRLFQSGALFDANHLQAERQRIADTLKNHGYYRFAKEYLFYKVSKVVPVNATEIDSSQINMVDVSMHLKPFVERINGKDVVFNYHPVFKIKDIFVFPNYDPQDAIRQGAAYYSDLDTFVSDDIHFLHTGKSKLKYSTITRGLFFGLNDLYSNAKVTRSTSYLNTLSAVKLANAFFREVDQHIESDTVDDLRVRWVNCYLNTTMSMRQSYSVDLEGNYASRDYFGIDGSLSYQHKNLLAGSEDFKLAFSASWANNTVDLTEQSNDLIFNSVQYGVETEITVPKFLIPYGFQGFNKRYSPKTAIGLGFSFEKRPGFSNQNITTSFGYRWNSSENVSHFFNVLDFFGTQIININDEIKAELIEKNLLADYSDKVIPSMNYTYLYNGKPKGIFDDFYYFRTKIESAGNILVGIKELSGAEKQGNRYFNDGEFPMYNFLNTPIAQYVRGELDFRYHQVFDPEKKLVYRLFLGMGYPYGNFPSMPIHKQFLAGGMSGLRGWSPGKVGPGNFSESIAEIYLSESSTTLPQQQRGEMKIEMNIEYRLKLNEMFETAFFLDVGNTWTLSEYNFSAQIADGINQDYTAYGLTEPIETKFVMGSFYKNLAYNSGFGLRFDLSFFVLRLDLGAKLKDPGDNTAGIFKQEGFFKLANWRLNFGIGYPF